MIRVTKQQRANAIEARDVMWPSVPPENVIPELASWRRGRRGRPDCGSVACFGGWCAWWPSFRAQGVRSNAFGAPVFRGDFGASSTLFGSSDLFVPRGSSSSDVHAPYRCTDHELVTYRLNWLIENSEVIE